MKTADALKPQDAPPEELQIPRDLLGKLPEELECKDTFLIGLKEKHMGFQNQLVRQIKSMSDESKRIIEDITVIEADIDKYQVQIEEWTHKMETLGAATAKVIAVKEPFRKKGHSLSKLKDYFIKELKRNK